MSNSPNQTYPMTFAEWVETQVIPTRIDLRILREAFEAGFFAGRAKSGYVPFPVEPRPSDKRAKTQ